MAQEDLLRSRAVAMGLFLCGLLMINFGLHVFTPYDQDHVRAEARFNPGGINVLRRPGNRHISSALNVGNGVSSTALRKGHHYIIGYGSLINSKSRAKTHQTGKATPVRVKGFRRVWNYAQPERQMSALGIVKDASGSVEGVIMRVPSRSLKKFDRREKRYRRVSVPVKDVSLYHRKSDKAKTDGIKLTSADKIWIYLTKEPTKPTQKLPVAQSYVDVVIAGCLEHGTKFAIDCARDTGGWRDKLKPENSVWINDRAKPRIYSKHFLSDRLKKKVDGILKKAIPQAFARRRDISEKKKKKKKKTKKNANGKTKTLSHATPDMKPVNKHVAVANSPGLVKAAVMAPVPAHQIVKTLKKNPSPQAVVTPKTS